MLTQLLRRVERTSLKQYKRIAKVAKKYAKISHNRIQRINRKYVGKVIASSLTIKMIGYMALFVAISTGIQPAEGESQTWVSSLKFDKTKSTPVVQAEKSVEIKVVPIVPPAPPKPAPAPAPASQPRATVARERVVTPAPKPVPAPAPAPVVPAIDVKAYARQRSAEMFGDGHWPALEALWTRESGWNFRAYNASSGACGIPQALPCSKGGANFRNDPVAQIEWGLRYIASRYGNPSNAWAFWNARHWY